MKRGQVFLIFIIVAAVALVALFFLFKASATGAPTLRLPSEQLPLGPKSLPEKIPGPQLPDTGLSTIQCSYKFHATIDWTCSQEIPPELISTYSGAFQHKYCTDQKSCTWSMTVPGVVVETEKKIAICSKNIPSGCSKEVESAAIAEVKKCLSVVKKVCISEDVKGSFTSYPMITSKKVKSW